jgi:hypothetical protein
VIGPIDYFVLKRFDRLPLTWLTFTCYIVVFSVVAYYGVKALRSGSTQLRAVTVVDAVSGQGAAWSSCYSGIFAPESDDYKLSNLSRGQWWSSFSPYDADYQYYGGQRRTTRRMTCTQEDGGSWPSYLPINIWSMQCLLEESAQAEMPITATVDLDGDMIHATVENLSDSPIAYGWIEIGGGRALRFGAMGAKEKREVTGRASATGSFNGTWPPEEATTVKWVNGAPPARQYSSYFSAGATGPACVAGACQSRGTVKRTWAIQDCLSQGAALVCAQFDKSPPGFGLANRSHDVTHMGLARLVVLPGKGGRS